MDLLPRLAERVVQETSEVYQAARRHEPGHVFTQKAQGNALPVDDNLKFRLIADIDTLLFEVNTCWELMRNLFQLVRGHVGRPIADGRDEVTNELKAALAGGNDEWFGWLDRQRNFVAHEGTPYLSIDVTNDDSYELLVTKEHPTTFGNPKKFFRYSELVDLVRGFNGAKQVLRAHLIGLFSQSHTHPT